MKYNRSETFCESLRTTPASYFFNNKVAVVQPSKIFKRYPAEVLFAQIVWTAVWLTTSKWLDKIHWEAKILSGKLNISWLFHFISDVMKWTLFSSTLKGLPFSQFKCPFKLLGPQLLWYPSSYYSTLQFIQFHGDGSTRLNYLFNLFNFLMAHCSESFLSLIRGKVSFVWCFAFNSIYTDVPLFNNFRTPWLRLF